MITTSILLTGLVVGQTLSARDVLRMDARSLYEQYVSQHLRLSEDGSAVVLQRGQLFEDDGPAAGYSHKPNVEKLTSGVWVKKELLIPDPKAQRATLLVAPGGEIHARVNGVAQKLERAGKVGNYWESYTFDPRALKPGKNGIVLSGSARIWIARDDEFVTGSRTRTSHPNRSAKSTDDGKTWDYDQLGSDGRVDGEYYVRLLLDQYRREGSLTLPVIDVGNLTGRVVGPPVSSVRPIRVRVLGQGGDAGRMSVRVRTGTTYVPGEKTWSAWREVADDGGTLRQPFGRYLQVGLKLTTSDPSITPKLKSMEIEATPKLSGDWTSRVTLLESHNEPIVRTSIPFEYEPLDHPKLKTLRKRFRLDEVVDGAQSEFETIRRLAGWSASQFSRGHLNESYPPWNALEILKKHRDGTPIGGFCLQNNLVFLQACESFGLTGRVFSIGPGNHTKRIRGGHEVVEIWSNEFKKWVYVDGNTAWYAVDTETKVPLSLWELRKRQLNAFDRKPYRPIEIIKIAETKYRWDGLESWPPFTELRLIPRSNFLEKPTPVPLNQGMRGWFWTGHYVWTDAECPARSLYSHRIARRGNFEWTLNATHFELEASETPGHIRVHLDTVTPGFKSYLAQIGDNPRRPVDAVFLWKLHKGKNRLEVLSQNVASREGAPSRIILDYQP